MSDDVNGPDGVVDRAVSALRQPVRADDSFEARVMSAVHASASRRNWWLRRRAVKFSPLFALAAAAGFALVVLGAQAGVRRMSAPASVDADRVDTVVLVRFVLNDQSARSVALVGSFNQWRREATPLRVFGAPGAWVVSVALPRGRHEYAFVVNDGTKDRWVADPFARITLDEFATETSFLSVGMGEND